MVLAAAFAILAVAAPAAAQGRRVALVIGNDTYPASPLVNARNDARSMAGTLRELGFTVNLLEDATRNQMVARVAEMSEALRPDDVAFFFYSGHGLQLEGENYLVPSDFEGTSVTAVRLTTLPVGEIQTALGRASVSVMVLDACRNNPYAATRSGGRGLAAMEARGSIIAFATGAGQTASDNPTEQNGLFTHHLLTTLREPNLPLREVFYRTRQRVYEASNGRQFPAVYDGLLGEIVLRPGGVGATPAPSFATATPPAAVAAAPPSVAAAPPSVGAGTAAVAGGRRFELLHFRNELFGNGMDAGVLTVFPGGITWSETGEVLSIDGPNKARKTRGDRDDFDAVCADIDHIARSVTDKDSSERWGKGWYQGRSALLRIGGKGLNFFVVEPIKGKPTYRAPRADVFEALRAACPNVVVK